MSRLPLPTGSARYGLGWPNHHPTRANANSEQRARGEAGLPANMQVGAGCTARVRGVYGMGVVVKYFRLDTMGVDNPREQGAAGPQGTTAAREQR